MQRLRPKQPSEPDAPTGLKVDEISDTSTQISWDAVGYEEGIKEYHVYRDGVYLDSSVGISLTDGGLTPETTYEYQVKVIGINDLESELSEILSATTESEIPEA